MSSNRRGPRPRKSTGAGGDVVPVPTAEELGMDPAVMEMFLEYAKELEAHHDRHERLVKLSRDVTIESKRIIFVLHRLGSTPGAIDENEVITEASSRLQKLRDGHLKKIGEELRGHDSHRYARAISPGLQEYVEATTFFLYVKAKTGTEILPTYDELQEQLQFYDVSLRLPQGDVILGIGDLTGEVMRMGISSLGVGQVNQCKRACDFLRLMHKCFLYIGGVHLSDLPQKSYTLKQSLTKLEDACCNLKMRQEEFPDGKLEILYDNKEDEY